VLINLTDKGQAVVDEQLPAIHAVITRAIDGVPKADRRKLLAALARVEANVEALASAPLPASKGRRKRRR
jgi:hypothetical protein